MPDVPVGILHCAGFSERTTRFSSAGKAFRCYFPLLLLPKISLYRVSMGTPGKSEKVSTISRAYVVPIGFRSPGTEIGKYEEYQGVKLCPLDFAHRAQPDNGCRPGKLHQPLNPPTASSPRTGFGRGGASDPACLRSKQVPGPAWCRGTRSSAGRSRRESVGISTFPGGRDERIPGETKPISSV